MGLPLQPELTPWTHAQRRVLLVILLVLAVVMIGVFAHVRREPARLLGSHGSVTSSDYQTVTLRLITGARQRISAVLYVVRLDEDGPVAHLIQALAEAVRRGVEVRVVLDRGHDWRSNEPDHKNDDAALCLTQAGVQVVWDEDERTTHAKAVVIDDRYVVVGSHNWTRSALDLNREWSLLIDDPQIAHQVQDDLAALPGW